jgi:hypothetical protein
MKIYISPLTAGQSGGGLNGNLAHIDLLLQQELVQAGFKSSFAILHVTLAHPTGHKWRSTNPMVQHFMKYYDTLPVSKIYRKAGKIEIAVKAPEFSEHFMHGDKANPQKQTIPETTLATILMDKFIEIAGILRSKLKKEDVFDLGIFEKVLLRIKESITPDFLRDSFFQYSKQSHDNQVAFTEKARDERQGKYLPKDKLIKDIRLYYDYNLPASMFYLNRFADVVLEELIKLDFRCPVYHHLYIAVADSREAALKKVIIVEDWYTYGIAVLPKATLFAANPAEQQTLVLNALRDGLMDIALLDDLDTDKILDAVQAAGKTGVLTERIFKAKENNKIAFVISTKTIAGANKEEIYFTLIDKKTEQTVRWKFGEENIYVIDGWFGSIAVTNKIVRTKPRAHMDLVLKGKQMNLEIDVEKTFANPDSAIKM